jgi:hypothetical protein
VYGDLHYHSQGTDNEGESGYAHRGVLQAMAAMGLDFLFATEHASDSAQLVNADIDTFLGAIPYGASLIKDELRDMSQLRWNQLLPALNLSGGGNREVTSFPRLAAMGRYATPQIFLGGEVDVIPEMTGPQVSSRMIEYGNGLRYAWDSCDQHPGNDALGGLVDVIACPGGALDLIDPARTIGGVAVNNRFWLKDVQGAFDKYYARQHMVHLPSSPLSTAAFVPSKTSTWGGATRRFKDLLDYEYDSMRKGVTFLAHPLAAASGNDVGRLGPDIVPYTEAQLDDAFRTQDVLGLQLWNEDNRLSTKPGEGDAKVTANELQPFFNKTTGGWKNAPLVPGLFASLHHGTYTWDKMLHWGIDPRKTAGISWLAPGFPRRVFMAGGSDAHGDLNYRREGYMVGTDNVVDTAIGKPRNLVFAGQAAGTPLPRPAGAVATATPVTQGQVVQALRSGNFSVTDGPALRIAIDKNNNGVIDDADTPMGGQVAYNATTTLPLLVEWKSTPEFGRVDHVDVYVGVHSDVLDLGMTYAPVNHGVRGEGTNNPQGFVQTQWTTPDGKIIPRLADSYFGDPNGKLRFNVPAPLGYGGVAHIAIVPKDYPVGRLTTVRTGDCSTPPHNPHVCRPGDICDDPFDDGNDCQISYNFTSPKLPTRLYLRAFAQTEGMRVTLPSGGTGCYPTLGQCAPRLAYSNPIWGFDNTPILSTPIDPTN